MKKICLLLTLLAACQMAAQSQVNSEIMPAAQTSWLTDSLKQLFRIQYPVNNVYRYTDKSGSYYCVLTESRDSIIPSKDTFHFRIRAVNLKQESSGQFSKVWDMSDYILQKDQHESNIWFWNQYIAFEDLDKDGLTDPVIVYGTAATNGTSDGRVKCMVFYKGEKIGVRHQNSLEQNERNTTVDKAFYNLPAAVQLSVARRLEDMVKQQQAVFSSGWQKAMKSKRTYFDEKNQ
ncbi:M949_RS01915 family surface polysaccharide biosynthesis protein [Pseudobacter ginsenosidimutans]|uniref:Uncharacterized protein n=1 Tax=Pseudobacter ginsenosidimutans TaxID=661488 RepID=A0A4Q7MYY3_9BACT|nr:hypothetical protein [Pseudobacter ginsenosidimutans]QEC40835.1 hypothetical protein FSB84_03665 [Pseudobacter ginsenosidimutans]RZS72433.1 hypothetical protein EV199_4354 [Pseudobacter ginsenosidimutans]